MVLECDGEWQSVPRCVAFCVGGERRVRREEMRRDRKGDEERVRIEEWRVRRGDEESEEGRWF